MYIDRFWQMKVLGLLASQNEIDVDFIDQFDADLRKNVGELGGVYGAQFRAPEPLRELIEAPK